MGELYIPPANGREIDKCFFHCDAWENESILGLDRIREIDAWHRKRRFRPYDKPDGSRGWFGYHYYIDPAGEFFRVRPIEAVPQAQSGWNSRSMALCVAGLHPEQFRGNKMDIVRKFVAEVVEHHGPAVTFHGHREVANKACPVFDYVRVVGIVDPGIEGGHLEGHNVAAPTWATLSLTCRGPEVKFLQHLLGLTEDGAFGQKTHAAVVKFQTEHHLLPDGVVGPLTWRTAFLEKR